MIATVRGKIFTGLSEGRRFTQLPWVRKQIKEKLGFEPYPGTLNLSLSPNIQIDSLLDRFSGWQIPAERGFCSGRFYRASIAGRLLGAVIRPETPNYPDHIIEIVAPIGLRDELNLRDGDELEIKIRLE